MFYFQPFFFKTTDPCVGESFLLCLHDPIFGTTNIGSLKSDCVNGPLIALEVVLLHLLHSVKVTVY